MSNDIWSVEETVADLENDLVEETIEAGDVVDMTDDELNLEVFDKGVVVKEDKTDNTATSKLTPEIGLAIAKLVGSGEKSAKTIAQKLDIPFVTDGEKVALVKKARIKQINEAKTALVELSEEEQTPEILKKISSIEKVIEIWKSLELKEKKVKLTGKQKKMAYLEQVMSVMLTSEYEPESEIEDSSDEETV